MAGIAAVLIGIALGTFVPYLPLPTLVAALPGLAFWPPAAGAAVLLGALSSWFLARLRHDPGVDVEGTLEMWSAGLVGRWESELARRRWIEPHLSVGWHLDVPDDEVWEAHVAAARAPAPPQGWQRPEKLDERDGALVDVLLERLPTRRLMLVGRSGAGKTVLLLHLALEMSDRAGRAGSGVPYPALLSLASWDPSRDLDEWLERRLVLSDPRLGRRASGRSWSVAAEALRTGRLLPVLDGLDEIGDEDQRVRALVGIDDWLRRARRPGLVVATRPLPAGSEQHLSAPRLTIIGHVDPIPTAAARDYLADHAGGAEWHDVLPDSPSTALTAAMRRPLGVWLAATVYARRHPGSGQPGPRELSGLADERAVTTRLIGRFLPAAYADPPRGSWTPARAVRWLRTIAGFTTQRAGPGGGHLVWWEVWRRAPRLVPAVLALPGAAAVGLVAGLDSRLGMGLGCGILAGIGTAIVAARAAKIEERATDVGPGIAFGFAGGIVGSMLGGLLAVEAGLDDTPWRGMIGALGAGIAAGAVARHRVPAAAGGVVGGMTVALTANTGTGLLAGLFCGLGAWVAGAMVISAARGLPARRLSSPNLWIVIGVAVSCGTAIGARAAVAYGPAVGSIAGLLIGGLGGVAAGCSAAPVLVSGFSADPQDVLVADRRTFWQMFALGGLTFGGGAAVAVNPWVGCAAFLTVGLIAGATRCAWPAFVVARAWFAMTGRLPPHLMEFLEDSYRRGVLRQIGAGYQIRHQELAEYLVAPQEPTTAK